jgi:hypothetical protein
VDVGITRTVHYVAQAADRRDDTARKHGVDPLAALRAAFGGDPFMPRDRAGATHTAE